MSQVFFLLPDADVPVSETVEPGRALLIGRNPNPTKLDRTALPLEVKQLRAVPIPSPPVSENHLLAWHEGGNVCLKDLNSRNGTTASLPPNRPVAFPDDTPL